MGTFILILLVEILYSLYKACGDAKINASQDNGNMSLLCDTDDEAPTISVTVPTENLADLFRFMQATGCSIISCEIEVEDDDDDMINSLNQNKDKKTMKVNGKKFVFGNEIKRQVIGIQNIYYGTRTENTPRPTTLREKIDAVLCLMKNGSMWFCIYRALVDADLHPKGDYAGFVSKISSLYPEGVPYGINRHVICELDVQSWSKSFDQWDRNDAPRSGNAYTSYEDLIEAFNALLLLPE